VLSGWGLKPGVWGQSPQGAASAGERRRRLIVQRAVGSAVIVLLPVILRNDLRLQHTREQFAIEQLVAQPAVQRFAVGILPRRPGRDVQRLHAGARQPVLQRLGDELRPVVAAEKARRPALGE